MRCVEVLLHGKCSRHACVHIEGEMIDRCVLNVGGEMGSLCNLNYCWSVKISRAPFLCSASRGKSICTKA